ncbi:MAG: TIGR03936 family radical SAM-associated protein [Clostridia bacterium]|nr:TIGR03936 family radical SAM-associated protein [Clostridia bacterium]
MKIIAAFEKTKEISYTSHLDVQRTLQRAFRRANLPLAFSKGFNPHPKLSFATALATGYTSAGEWIEVELDKELTPEEFTERVNAALPGGMRFVSAFVAEDGFPTLSKLLVAAKYVVTLYTDAPVTTEDLRAAVDAIMQSDEVIVEKKTKSGIRPANIRPEILEAEAISASDGTAIVAVVGTLNAAGGLRAETFARALFERLSVNGRFTAHRTALCFEGSDRLPRLR